MFVVIRFIVECDMLLHYKWIMKNDEIKIYLKSDLTLITVCLK